MRVILGGPMVLMVDKSILMYETTCNIVPYKPTIYSIIHHRCRHFHVFVLILQIFGRLLLDIKT